MKGHQVQRKGFKEAYDDRKVYASVYSACIFCKYTRPASEKIADNVAKAVTVWIKNKKIVNSDHIFKQVVKILENHDKKVAAVYETFADVD